MQVDSINIDSRQIYSGATRFLTEKISGSSSTNYKDEREKASNLSREQKNYLVAEKLENNQLESHNNLRFQENTPVSKLLDLIKSYNEPNRASLPEIEDSENHSHATFTELDETAQDEAPVGYYIVLDEKQKVKKQKALKGRFDLVKDKIARTYNLNSYRSNGALVNITA
jgi:hypothetical protein